MLPARLRGYSAAHLDALCTSGDVVWVGAGPIGAGDGRVRLFFRDQVRLLLPPKDDEAAPSGRVHDAVRAHLAQRGASFWSNLRAAATDVTDTELLAALWDLVWAGEVTNDSLVPMRALLSGKPKRTAPKTARPRPGRLTRIGPPAGAGRWSLVSWLAEARASATEVAHASGAAAARTQRRADARGRVGRGCRGRVRRRVPRAEGARGARASAARLLRCRAGGDPVRAAGRGRSPPGAT